MKKNKNTIKTDIAWKHLYHRLESDGLVPEKNEDTTFWKLKPTRYRWGAAFVFVLIVVSAVTLFVNSPQKNYGQPDLLSLQNKKGAITLVTTLEDGSIVYLSDDAKLDYPPRFEENIREVYLQGNALFDVNGNKERPFLVNTQNIQVEVLGTSFYIEDDGAHKFELAVRRGSVKVRNKKDGKFVLVNAGETVRLLSGDLRIQPTEDKTVFDYYTRKIQFKDEPIGNILHVINKEFDKTILQTSPELSERPLTVTFSNNSPESVAQLICLALDLTYTQKEGVYMITDAAQ